VARREAASITSLEVFGFAADRIFQENLHILNSERALATTRRQLPCTSLLLLRSLCSSWDLVAMNRWIAPGAPGPPPRPGLDSFSVALANPADHGPSARPHVGGDALHGVGNHRAAKKPASN